MRVSDLKEGFQVPNKSVVQSGALRNAISAVSCFAVKLEADEKVEQKAAPHFGCN